MGGRASSAFRHLPLSVADRLDFFRAEGVGISWLEFADDAQALQAVQRGLADVGVMGFEQILLAPGGRAAVRSLVLQARAPQLALAVSVRALPKYRSLADLRRCEVGVGSTGMLAQAMVCTALMQAGVSVSDVHLVEVGDGARALAALRSGRVQALCHADPVMSRLERRGEVRVVNDARTLAGTQALFGGAMPGSCLVAPVSFLNQRADEAQALVHAVVHALKWLQTAAPADIVKIVPPDDFIGDRSLYLAALARMREAMSPDGLMPEGGPETSLRALGLLAPALAAQRPHLARSFTQEFALKAKQKFSA